MPHHRNTTTAEENGQNAEKTRGDAFGSLAESLFNSMDKLDPTGELTGKESKYFKGAPASAVAAEVYEGSVAVDPYAIPAIQRCFPDGFLERKPEPIGVHAQRATKFLTDSFSEDGVKSLEKLDAYLGTNDPSVSADERALRAARLYDDIYALRSVTDVMLPLLVQQFGCDKCAAPVSLLVSRISKENKRRTRGLMGQASEADAVASAVKELLVSMGLTDVDISVKEK